jgi:hypothetical protein
MWCNFGSAVLIAVFTHKRFKVLDDEARLVFEENVNTLWVIYENFYKGLDLDGGDGGADTVIAALGEIGRLSNDCAFPIIVRSFLEILMKNRPLLNSFVYSKMFAIAKYKGVSIVELVSPMLEEVTTFLLGQLSGDGGVLDMSNRTVKIVASIVSTLFPTNFQKFLFDTLEYSLPHLVASQASLTLDFISTTLDESVGVLCCREIQNILLYACFVNVLGSCS